MYERILVPLDGSALAEAALAHAAQMAEIFQAELLLLRTVVVPTFPGYDTTAVSRAVLAESETYLQSIAKTLQPRGRRIRTVVRAGKAAETIVEHAMQQEVSVIVMATHGHRGGDGWPLGSIAEKVLRSMQVPVLLIRATPSVASRGSAFIPGREEDDGVYKTILVPLDGSDLAASILEHVVTLARGYGARLLLLTVGQPQPVALLPGGDLLTLTFQAEDYVDRVRASLAAQGLEVSTTVRIGDPASEILEVAQRHHVDLIIINSRGGEGAPSPFFGSVAAKVAGASPMPVLVFHAPHVPEGGGRGMAATAGLVL